MGMELNSFQPRSDGLRPIPFHGRKIMAARDPLSIVIRSHGFADGRAAKADAPSRWVGPQIRDGVRRTGCAWAYRGRSHIARSEFAVQDFSRPCGTGSPLRLKPALKGWAILNGPSGTWCARYVGAFGRRHIRTHLINGRARAPRAPHLNRILKIKRIVHYLPAARSENAPYQYIYEMTSKPWRSREVIAPLGCTSCRAARRGGRRLPRMFI